MKTVVSMAAPADAQAQSERVAHTVQRPQMVPGHGAFVPVLLATLALLLGLGWQCYLLLAERDGLQGAHTAQQLTVDNAGKLRGSLDALAADTQRLADAGNPNAALLVAELRRRGITINAKAGASAQAEAGATPAKP